MIDRVNILLNIWCDLRQYLMHQIDDFGEDLREYLIHQMDDFDEDFIEYLMHQISDEQMNNKQITDE